MCANIYDISTEVYGANWPLTMLFKMPKIILNFAVIGVWIGDDVLTLLFYCFQIISLPYKYLFTVNEVEFWINILNLILNLNGEKVSTSKNDRQSKCFCQSKKLFWWIKQALFWPISVSIWGWFQNLFWPKANLLHPKQKCYAIKSISKTEARWLRKKKKKKASQKLA